MIPVQTTAANLIRRSLRLINVPGKGATLGETHLSDSFESLQDILNSQSVSRQFVPGIRRHFFEMSADKANYSYGADAGLDFRSDDFDDDPAPIRIEDAYIRSGQTIINNELVDEYRFENAGNWVESGTADISNNDLLIEGIGSVNQALALVDGTTYTLRFTCDVSVGDVLIDILANAVSVDQFTVTETGGYEFDFVFAGTVPTVDISCADSADSVIFTRFSIIERGKERLELPDFNSVDYQLKKWDQKLHNLNITKGDYGRPDRYLYSRGFPHSRIEFDNGGEIGDILVMDVLCNRVAVNNVNDVLRIHPEALLWLRFELADVMSGEYSKELTRAQMKKRDEAWEALAAGNRRKVGMRVDSALLAAGGRSQRFNINGGDY